MGWWSYWSQRFVSCIKSLCEEIVYKYPDSVPPPGLWKIQLCLLLCVPKLVFNYYGNEPLFRGGMAKASHQQSPKQPTSAKYRADNIKKGPLSEEIWGFFLTVLIFSKFLQFFKIPSLIFSKFSSSEIFLKSYFLLVFGRFSIATRQKSPNIFARFAHISLSRSKYFQSLQHSKILQTFSLSILSRGDSFKPEPGSQNPMHGLNKDKP